MTPQRDWFLLYACGGVLALLVLAAILAVVSA